MTDDQRHDRDTQVRERAYLLWEREGRPAGRADSHWHMAAREIDEADQPAMPDPVEPTPAAAAPSKPARSPRPTKAATAPKRKRAVTPKVAG